MLIEDPIKLPNDMHMPCYACEKLPATHLCRYKIGDLIIQICLCLECMQMDTRRLLKDTVGIQDIQIEHPGENHLIFDEVRFSSLPERRRY